MKDNMDDDKASAIHGQTFVSIEDAIAIHPSRSSTTNVVFVDGSWFLPTLGRNGKEEFLAGPRIEGARFLDIDDIASTSSNMNLPHMMPTYSLFSSWMDAMDITTDDHIVVYGSKQCPFVSRAYWNIRTFHEPNQCHLLDGSLQDWIDANGPIEAKETIPSFSVVTASDLSSSQSSSSEPKYRPRNVDPKKNIVDLTQIKQYIADGRVVQSTSNENSQDEAIVIVDARSNGRFLGIDDEPRPGLRKGHMPGAINIPFTTFLQESNVNRFLPRDEIRAILQQNGLALPLHGDYDNPIENYEQQSTTLKNTMIVSTCGSGVTASCLLVALTCIIGPDRVDDIAYLYDGSWIEWGGTTDVPVVTNE
jgi:thiosulfate/3-mercaptopyruvate sulfurtransferase